MTAETTVPVLDDVWDERTRQDDKWGDQSGSRDGTGPNSMVLQDMLGIAEPAHLLATLAKDVTNTAMSTPHGASMAEILLEEVFEALAEDDAAKLRAELVQVAAVAVAWCEYIDKRGAN